MWVPTWLNSVHAILTNLTPPRNRWRFARQYLEDVTLEVPAGVQKGGMLKVAYKDTEFQTIAQAGPGEQMKVAVEVRSSFCEKGTTPAVAVEVLFAAAADAVHFAVTFAWAVEGLLYGVDGCKHGIPLLRDTCANARATPLDRLSSASNFNCSFENLQAGACRVTLPLRVCRGHARLSPCAGCTQAALVITEIQNLSKTAFLLIKHAVGSARVGSVYGAGDGMGYVALISLPCAPFRACASTDSPNVCIRCLRRQTGM